jgi:hypothetical protein
VRRRPCIDFTIIGCVIAAASASALRYEYAGGWGRPNPPELVNSLSDVAFGPDGNLYLLHDGGDHGVYVQVLTPAGNRVRFFGGYEHGLGGGSSQGNIAVGPDGSVHVVGFVAEGVTKFPPGRKFPQVWKWYRDYFHVFNDVAVGPGGEVYALLGHRTLERFTAEGERLAPWELHQIPEEEGRPVGYIEGVDVGPEGRVFVTDDSARHLLYYMPDGAWGGEITWEEGVMGPAVDVALARDGTAYVTDGYNLAVIEEDGSVVAAWPVIERQGEERQWLRGLAAGPDGNVYVGVCNVVKCFTEEGVPAGEIDATVPPADCFSYPSGIAVSPEGLVYVTGGFNNRVAYFTAAGEPLGVWDRRTIPDVNMLYDVDCCPDGTVAVRTRRGSDDSPACVGFYDAAGTLVREWPVVAGGRDYPAYRLAIGPDGSAFVSTDAGVPAVLHFAADGAHLGGWPLTDEPASPYSLYTSDLAVGPDGTVYATSHDNSFVQLYSSTGEARGRWDLTALLGGREPSAAGAGGVRTTAGRVLKLVLMWG